MANLQRANRAAFTTNRQIETLLREKDATLAVKWAAMVAKHPERTQVLRGHRMVGGPFGGWFRLDDTAYSADDKALLRQYSGDGGLAKHGASGVGLLQEFYTPVAVAEACVALAMHYGWNSNLGHHDAGRVLEPSCGPGNFLAALPGVEADAFELNPVSARVAQILYPNASLTTGEFECHFIDKAKNRSVGDKLDSYPKYDLAIGNPPFGNYFGRCANMGELKHTGAPTLETYFLSRCLDLLKPSGLLVFILPASFMQNGKKLAAIKERIAAKAGLLDAWRLWNGALYHTEELTDICVFQRLPLTHSPIPLPEWSHDRLFQQRPDRILGSYTGNGGAWGRAEYSGSVADLARLHSALAGDAAAAAAKLRLRLRLRARQPV